MSNRFLIFNENLIQGNIPSEGSASQGGESEEISSDSGHEQPIPSKKKEIVELKIIYLFLVQDLSELNHNPRFRALRRIVQEDPDQRKTLMVTLKATQPVLYQVKSLSNIEVYLEIYFLIVN